MKVRGNTSCGVQQAVVIWKTPRPTLSSLRKTHLKWIQSRSSLEPLCDFGRLSLLAIFPVELSSFPRFEIKETYFLISGAKNNCSDTGIVFWSAGCSPTITTNRFNLLAMPPGSPWMW